MSYEPPALEVFLTLAAGSTLAAPFYRRYIDNLDLRGDETVLDFGSGSGMCSRHLARRLQRRGGRLTCVDVSAAWIATAKRTLRHFRNVDYRLGALADLPLAPESYDVVFLHFVLHDIPAGERAGIVRRLAWLLKPGGRLLVREPSAREGIPVEALRALMCQAGLVETRLRAETHGYTGPIVAGEYRRDLDLTG
ncbi:MAG TPA: class I SAM-dependent methyltransferase [Anaerolineaceae bacterium]|nr:class I SAM-dependent methyltransferase [Anaerolineaceae bacterium]